MKREYEAPKAEKMVFDYSEVVTASGVSKCIWKQPDQEGYEGCKDNLENPGHWTEAPNV